MLKKHVVIKPKKMNIPKFDYKNLIFLSLFISGLIIGLLVIKKDVASINNVLSSIFENYFIEKGKNEFLYCFINNVSIYIILPVTIFILGLSAVGIPIILLFPVISGTALGIIIGFLYSAYYLQGLGYAAVVIIPAASIIIATFLKCCIEGVFMSLEIFFSITTKNQNKKNINEFKEYCLKFLLFLIPFFVAALINAICFKLFGNLFLFI